MTTCSDFDRAEAPSPDQMMRAARDLLIEALNLLDRADAPGHLAARLQHVIDDLGE